MTRLEALKQLATGVMGWTRHTPYNEQYPCFYLPGLLEGVSVQMNPDADIQLWDLFTNPAQALDLAEAWCKQQKGRWFEHEGLIAGLHRVYLFWDFPNIDPVMAEAPTFAAALTGAVREAEGIVAVIKGGKQ